MGRMKERMLRGELYIADDEELAADYARAGAHRALQRHDAEQEQRDEILRALLGGVGHGVDIRPPFRCEYCAPISIGPGTFINYDCLMLDVAPIATARPARSQAACSS
jgi:maltose O-acetyltransferase